MLTIPKYPFDKLRQRGQIITQDEIKTPAFQRFVHELMQTLESQFPLGAGLAANQVGVLKRVFVINLEIDKNQFLKQVFINPKMTSVSAETEIDWEGCLSFPNQWGQVKRPISITVQALDQIGRSFETPASHFYSRLLQHEIDHLSGVLFIDKLESDILNSEQLNKILKQTPAQILG